MVGLQSLMFQLTCISFLHVLYGSYSAVQDVIHESSEIDELLDKTSTDESEYEMYSPLAGGPVSIDCLRCLCLKASNCRRIGCVLVQGSIGCGYFMLTSNFWIDCGRLGKDWRTCSRNLTCASQCVQNYMKMYVKQFQCFQNCEGYSREFYGGPNGCNNPRTVAFWERLQQIPGCKGVQ